MLPPYQKRGIGAQLIEAVYTKFKDDSRVTDITIGHPTDAFRRVHRFVIAKLCETLPSFAPEYLRNEFSNSVAKEAKIAYKIDKAHSRIAHEIWRLMVTDELNEDEYLKYKRYVMERLDKLYRKRKVGIAPKEKGRKNVQEALASLPSDADRINGLKNEYQVKSIVYSAMTMCI